MPACHNTSFNANLCILSFCNKCQCATNTQRAMFDEKFWFAVIVNEHHACDVLVQAQWRLKQGTDQDVKVKITEGGTPQRKAEFRDAPCRNSMPYSKCIFRSRGIWISSEDMTWYFDFDFERLTFIKLK